MAQPAPKPILKIASPCSANWDEMSGDERVRFCGLCQKNVYDFTSMRESEILPLVARTEGRLCARMYVREDGTMIAGDCPVGVAKLRRKFMLGVAAAVLFCVGAASWIASQLTGAQPNWTADVPFLQNLRALFIAPTTGALAGDAEAQARAPKHAVVRKGKLLRHDVRTDE